MVRYCDWTVMEFTAKYQKVQNRWKRQRIIKICPSGYFVWYTMNRLNWKKIEIAIMIVFSIKILKFCHLESDLICHHLISLTEILVLLSDLLFPHLNKLYHYTAIFFLKRWPFISAFTSTLISQFSHSFISDSLWPHELQHARLPCPSPTPGVCSNPRPWS